MSGTSWHIISGQEHVTSTHELQILIAAAAAAAASTPPPAPSFSWLELVHTFAALWDRLAALDRWRRWKEMVLVWVVWSGTHWVRSVVGTVVGGYSRWRSMMRALRRLWSYSLWSWWSDGSSISVRTVWTSFKRCFSCNCRCLHRIKQWYRRWGKVGIKQTLIRARKRWRCRRVSRSVFLRCLGRRYCRCLTFTWFLGR